MPAPLPIVTLTVGSSAHGGYAVHHNHAHSRIGESLIAGNTGLIAA
jgi:hypothetical protein